MGVLPGMASRWEGQGVDVQPLTRRPSMTDALKAVSPLRRRMIDDMSLRNLSPATQRSYLHAVTKFSRYCGRSPDRLGLEDVRAFQVHLVSQGHFVAGAEPDGMRLALLLRCDAGPSGDP